MASLEWQHPNEEIHCPEWHQDCLAVTLTLAGCFSLKELKKFCRLTDWKISSSDMGPAQCMEILHQACHGSPVVVKAVEKSLAGRFRAAMGKVRQSDLDGIHEMWAASDWPFPILWASLADEREEVRLKARGFLHELIWAAVNALKQNDRSEAQAERIKSLSGAVAGLQSEIRTLRRELKQKPKVIREPAVEDTSLPARKNPKKMNEMKMEINRLRQLVAERDASLKEMEQKLAAGRKPLLPDNHVLNMLPRPVFDQCVLQNTPSNASEKEHRCTREDRCLDCPLEGRRILVIGGLERMETTYREVVHQMGGRLCYHCGHVKSNSKKLKNMVARADGAIFITSVNSHAAQSVVKDTCKKAGTPLLILKETGVNSLEKALRGMAA